MILYSLKCKKGHEFEAWFASSGAFDTQEKRGQLATRGAISALPTLLVAHTGQVS